MPESERPRSLRYVSKGGVRRVASRTRDAAACIGALHEGVHVTGVTAGQFSQVDIVEHMVHNSPGGVARVSTWTTGVADVQRLRDLKRQGLLADVRILIDRDCFLNSPSHRSLLAAELGDAAFRCLSVHAKVAIVDGEAGASVLRSSMNQNKNLRTEQFDLSAVAEIADFYREWFDALWDEASRSHSVGKNIKAAFDRLEPSDEGRGEGDHGLDLDIDIDLDSGGIDLGF